VRECPRGGDAPAKSTSAPAEGERMRFRVEFKSSGEWVRETWMLSSDIDFAWVGLVGVVIVAGWWGAGSELELWNRVCPQ
jgi:hypothetical protein